VAQILVVDDESSMRFLLRVTFESEGHRVEEAANGLVAVESIEGGRLPDLVATDYMMPLLNGGELIARLRRNPATAAIPIVLISASPGSERRTEADAFFRKPYDPSALVACVEELLARDG
jgi:two-component system cell cycle response regulator